MSDLRKDVSACKSIDVLESLIKCDKAQMSRRELCAGGNAEGGLGFRVLRLRS